MTSARDWARFYVVKRGWALTPLHYMVGSVECSCIEGVVCAADPLGKAGKHPVKGSWTDPSTMIRTEEGVEQFWGTRPWNVGLPTGQINHLIVIDLDPRNGGFNSLDEFESIRPGGPLPATLTAHTGGGGRHLFYSLPAGVAIKKGPMHKDYPGIDIQSDGAQVVLPPSLHRSGIRYVWADGRNGGEDLTVLPDDMIEFLSKRGSGSGGGGSQVDLDQIMRDGYVPEGQRNNALYAYACRQARRVHADTAKPGPDLDLKIQELTAAVVGWNATFCRPPLETDEVLGRVMSAVDWVRSDPGNVDRLPPEVQAWLEERNVVAVSDEAAAPAAEAESVAEDPAPEQENEEQPPVSGPPDEDSLGDDGQPGNRTLTDNGNARRLVDYFGRDIRYTPGLGWHVWDGLVWAPDPEDLRISAFVREIPVKVVGELPTTKWQVADIIAWADKSRDAGRISKAKNLAVSDARIIVPPTAWDVDHTTLAVRNGIVDLKTGNIVPPTRDQHITKRSAVSYGAHVQNDRFRIFLEQTTNGDKDFAAWLQRAAGYTLTGLTSEECFFLVYGPPNSGKSTFVEILGTLLGDYRMSLDADKIMQQKFTSSSDEYYIAQMLGKRMILVSELEEARRMKEAAVKRLTGQDTMSGRAPGGSPFNFRSIAKLWVATNHRPQVRDAGMWRRMKAVPFLNVPLAADATLKPFLLDPQGGLPAALAWAVEGAKQWFAHGLGACSVVSAATADYKESEDKIGMFLREELRAGEGVQVGLIDVHGRYQQWAEDRDEKRVAYGWFAKHLIERGLDIAGGQSRSATLKGYTVIPQAVPEPGIASALRQMHWQ